MSTPMHTNSASITLKNVRVMVIEDQREMRRILSVMLGTIGVKHVTEAENGADAIRILQHMKDLPHVILLDLYMDKMDGLQFAQKMRLSKIDNLKGIRLVVITGDNDLLLKSVSEQLGAVEVLHKPVGAPELKETIIRALRGDNP